MEESANAICALRRPRLSRAQADALRRSREVGDDLSADVQPGEVVVAILRHVQPVAGEHHRRFEGRGKRSADREQRILAEGETLLPSVANESEAGTGLIERAFDESHRLHE
jgi:hypothetical protein